MQELEDGVAVEWDGRKVFHNTMISHGVADGDELWSIWFGSQQKANDVATKNRELKQALALRTHLGTLAPRVALKDCVWVKYYPHESDLASGKHFRRVLGTVTRINGHHMHVRMKLNKWETLCVHWQLVVHAGAVVVPQRGDGEGACGELLARRVRVYWPDDDCFYEGVVEGWDSVSGHHTVQYDDGQVVTELLGGEDAPYWFLL